MGVREWLREWVELVDPLGHGHGLCKVPWDARIVLRPIRTEWVDRARVMPP